MASSPLLGTRPPDLPPINFLVVGTPSCGKTSFLQHITGIDAATFHLANTPYSLRNSAQRNAPSLDFYESQCLDSEDRPVRPDVVIITFDIGSRISLDSVLSINQETIHTYGIDIPTVLLGLKRDIRHDEQHFVQPMEAYLLAQKMELSGYMECSAKSGEHIPLVVEDLVKKGLDVKMGVLNGRNGEFELGDCVIQ